MGRLDAKRAGGRSPTTDRFFTALCIVAVSTVTACGSDDSSDGSGGGGTGGGASEPLPDVCAYESAYDEDCQAVAGHPRASICQGAPTDMILVHDCEYQGARVGVGNFYCCP